MIEVTGFSAEDARRMYNAYVAYCHGLGMVPHHDNAAEFVLGSPEVVKGFLAVEKYLLQYRKYWKDATTVAKPELELTTVWGASDDLVELEGRFYEEYGAYDTDNWLQFDHGVILRVKYDHDGIWRIENHSKDHAQHFVTITRCEDRVGFSESNGDIYSDLATVTGGDKVRLRRNAR